MYFSLNISTFLRTAQPPHLYKFNFYCAARVFYIYSVVRCVGRITLKFCVRAKFVPANLMCAYMARKRYNSLLYSLCARILSLAGARRSQQHQHIKYIQIIYCVRIRRRCRIAVRSRKYSRIQNERIEIAGGAPLVLNIVQPPPAICGMFCVCPTCARV